MGSRRSLVSLWVTLTAAGTLLAIAARGAGPLPGDLALTRWLQYSLPPDDFAGWLLAYPERILWFLTVAFLAIMLLRRQWVATLFMVAGGVSALLVGDALKLLVARTRPSAELALVYNLSEDYGFPSTTALLSVVLLGVMCYLTGREIHRVTLIVVVLGVSLTLVFAIGISRVYLGEHWATDVLGGWVFGGAWLLVLVAIHRWWTSRRPHLGAH